MTLRVVIGDLASNGLRRWPNFEPELGGYRPTYIVCTTGDGGEGMNVEDKF